VSVLSTPRARLPRRLPRLPARLRIRRGPVLVVLLVAFLNNAVWALITPPFEGPDEYAHVAYAVDLAERGKAPVPTSPGNFTSSENVYALDATSSFSVLGANATRPPWAEGTRRIYEQRIAREHPPRNNGGGGNITSATHGPIYYLLPALGYLISGGSFFARLFAMRLASALLGAIAAACVYGTVRELIPRARWAAVAAGLLVAFQPMFGFMSGVVNADNGVNCAAAAVLFLVTRGLRRGFSPLLAAALPIVFVLGVFAKATILAIAPAVVLALLFALWRRRLPLRSIITMAGAFGGILLVWAIVAHVLGRPFLHVPTSPGPGGAAGGTFKQKFDYVWQVFLPPLPGMIDLYTGPFGVPAWTIYVREIWGVFGWASMPLPNRVFKIIFLLLIGVALLAVAAIVRERDAVRRRLPELLVLAVAAIGVSVSVHVAFIRTGPFNSNIGEQGRYLFPAITTAIVVMVGACFGVGRRYAPLLATSMVTAMMLFSAATQFFEFRGYFT
jgi:4-amino-4-deoxy-L-arabinose transferase-like glycosyltransferase